MHPILETSVSINSSVETFAFVKPSEKEVETSPFLQLILEENTKETLQEVPTSSEEPQEVVQNMEVEEGAQEEASEELEEVENTKFIVPNHWEMAEELSSEEISLVQDVEEKDANEIVEKPFLDWQNIEVESKESQEQETTTQTNLDVVDLKSLAFQQKNSLKAEQLKEEKQEHKEKDFLGVKQNAQIEKVNFPANEPKLESVSFEYVASLEKTLFPIQTKVEKNKSHNKQREAINSIEIKNQPTQETKLSIDILPILKEKTLSIKPEVSEGKTASAKETISHNAKITFVKEEQKPDSQPLRIHEKEEPSFIWSVQQIKIPTSRDIIKPNASYENKRSFQELVKKNTLEFVKNVKFQILENGKNFAYLELEPKELGKVLLQISMENDKIHGKLFFETESAKLIFQSEVQNLKNELRIAGLELESLLLDLNSSEQNFQEFSRFEKFPASETIRSEISPSEVDETQNAKVSQTTDRLLDVSV